MSAKRSIGLLLVFLLLGVLFLSCGKTVLPYEEGNPATYLEPDKKPLPLAEAFDGIREGMTLTEVVALVGRPQRDAGAGAILYEFDPRMASSAKCGSS